MTPNIDMPRERIAEFCRKNGIRKLELFGSVLRENFGPLSDVDVLVEFLPGRTPGLDFFVMDQELAEILGRKVDLLTRRSVETNPNYIFRKEAHSLPGAAITLSQHRVTPSKLPSTQPRA